MRAVSTARLAHTARRRITRVAVIHHHRLDTGLSCRRRRDLERLRRRDLERRRPMSSLPESLRRPELAAAAAVAAWTLRAAAAAAFAQKPRKPCSSFGGDFSFAASSFFDPLPPPCCCCRRRPDIERRCCRLDVARRRASRWVSECLPERVGLCRWIQNGDGRISYPHEPRKIAHNSFARLWGCENTNKQIYGGV